MDKKGLSFKVAWRLAVLVILIFVVAVTFFSTEDITGSAVDLVDEKVGYGSFGEFFDKVKGFFSSEGEVETD